MGLVTRSLQASRRLPPPGWDGLGLWLRLQSLCFGASSRRAQGQAADGPRNSVVHPPTVESYYVLALGCALAGVASNSDADPGGITIKSWGTGVPPRWEYPSALPLTEPRGLRKVAVPPVRASLRTRRRAA